MLIGNTHLGSDTDRCFVTCTGSSDVYSCSSVSCMDSSTSSRLSQLLLDLDIHTEQFVVTVQLMIL